MEFQSEPRVWKMIMRLAVSTIAVMAASICLSISVAAQTAPPSQSSGQSSERATGQTDDTKWKSEKWSTPQPPETYWEKVKSAPAPKHDITGIWDAAGVPQGVQPTGAYEYPDDLHHDGTDTRWGSGWMTTRSRPTTSEWIRGRGWIMWAVRTAMR